MSIKNRTETIVPPSRITSSKMTPSGSGPVASQSGVPLDEVAMRAYQKWVEGGCKHGSDKQLWLEAEAEIKAETAKRSIGSGVSKRKADKKSKKLLVSSLPPSMEGLADTLEFLTKKLDDEDESIADEAIAKFTFFGNEALLAIINALNADSPRIRARARHCFFAVCHDFPLPPNLRETLGSDVTELRLASIREIVRIHPLVCKAIAAHYPGWEALIHLVDQASQVLRQAIAAHYPGWEALIPFMPQSIVEATSSAARMKRPKPAHAGEHPRSSTEAHVEMTQQDQIAKSITKPAQEVEHAGEHAIEKHQEQLGAALLPVRWKSHLDMYPELRALQFSTTEDYGAAAKLLWSDLAELPFEILGNNTIMIPAEAWPHFKGLKFTESEVLSPKDLPAEELAELRRDQGPY